MSTLGLTSELMMRSQLAAAARAAGVDLEFCASGAALVERGAAVRPRLIIIDLSEPGLDLAALVPALKAAGVSSTVLAFGPHVHTDRLQSAKAAGCDLVISRGQFHAQAASL